MLRHHERRSLTGTDTVIRALGPKV